MRFLSDYPTWGQHIHVVTAITSLARLPQNGGIVSG
jgi:hypothetical protein